MNNVQRNSKLLSIDFDRHVRRPDGLPFPGAIEVLIELSSVEGGECSICLDVITRHWDDHEAIADIVGWLARQAAYIGGTTAAVGVLSMIHCYTGGPTGNEMIEPHTINGWPGKPS